MPAGSVKTLEATQLRTVIFVPHVTDIATQEIRFSWGGRCRRNVMNRTFHPFRAPTWNGFKRYFIEWRNRALIRHELRMSSDRQSSEDIIPF